MANELQTIDGATASASSSGDLWLTNSQKVPITARSVIFASTR
jgi:hypothetical protein